jgi:methylenetetrahydrofolate reductase (NADPH)
MTASLSFEVFPPRDPAQAETLSGAVAQLSALQPDYVSVTFGAGGSTRSRTVDTVLALNGQQGVPAAPHISCMAEALDDLTDLLQQYRQAGIDRLVVLRGDRPSGGGMGVLAHAVDLVRLIRQQHGDYFHIEVAAYPEHHPESTSPDADVRHFADKVKAGADGAITQYFYTADSYFRFVDEAAALGVDVPITPGIMPITNYAGLARFSATCGAEIPMWIAKRLQAWDQQGDQDSLRAFGHDVVAQLCQRLLTGGAPGLHFYTLNRAAPTLALCQALNLTRPQH